uniref:SNTX MACPF/CDC-like domain-containing protein n=1 Tax=Panagrolaimus davidi TaxID=227884 RepID=A0A914R5A9_9BILA
MSSSQKVITVPPLGRTADLGDIYDARKNEFAGISVFSTKIEQTHIDIRENPNTSHKFSYAAKKSEKIDAFDIHGELKLRILCGMIEVEGSAEYIKNSRNNRNSIQCSYILKSTTCKESFNWRLDQLKNSFNFSGIENAGTHMVVGIQYGGNGIVALTCSENQETEEIKEKLAGKFNGFPLVSGSSGGVNSNSEFNDGKLNVSVNADVSFEPSDDVTSVEGAKTFMRHLGDRLRKYNEGKGVQVSFELVPIKTVVDFYKITDFQNVIYKTLESPILYTISHKLNEIEDIEEELNERLFELENSKKYFSSKDIEWWKKEKLHFKNTVAECHSSIDNKLVQDEISSANDLLNQENTVIADLKRRVHIFISSSDKLISKLIFIKNAEENSVKYVHQENQLAQLKLQTKKLYICFISAQNYHSSFNLLRKFVQEKKDAEMKYVMIDADLLCEVVKRELGMKKLPQHPLYIFSNGKYEEDPKTRKAPCKHQVSVGIDLGTTNSCVAVYSKNGVEVLADDLGHKVVPSYVFLEGNTAVVGQITDAKRMLGKKFNDLSIQKDKKTWPFEIGHDTHERPKIHVKNYKDEWVFPENISALVLGKMKEIVETFHLKDNEKLLDAVITVPAYFNDVQKEATKYAAKLAGLNVLKLLNESSAAGLAFSYQDREFRERTVFIYDFGGGTIDVLSLKINHGQINVPILHVKNYKEGRVFPEKLSAFVWGKMKKIVELNSKDNEKLLDAVITVPAYFNDVQKEATKYAARLAGLNVLKLLNESSAAGLAFCYQSQEFRERTVFVYDFGGGTFDVSIMKINHGQINVIADKGDTHLGGNDIDEILVNYCIEKFGKNIRSTPESMRLLKLECINAKESLSNSQYFEFDIPNLYDGEDFEIKVTRQDFERICQDLFDKTIKIVKNVLNEAKVLPTDIDEVLLVGGSSRIPKIQEMLAQIFGAEKISKRINPDEAVAYGAAIQAAMITGEI